MDDVARYFLGGLLLCSLAAIVFYGLAFAIAVCWTLCQREQGESREEEFPLDPAALDRFLEELLSSSPGTEVPAPFEKRSGPSGGDPMETTIAHDRVDPIPARDLPVSRGGTRHGH